MVVYMYIVADFSIISLISRTDMHCNIPIPVHTMGDFKVGVNTGV
jgi:hypothetical protein